MKITVNQLRKIIKEEVQASLNEGRPRTTLTKDTPVEYALGTLVGQGKITANEAYNLFQSFAKYASEGGSWDFDYIRSAIAEYSRAPDTGEDQIYKSAHRAFSKMGNRF